MNKFQKFYDLHKEDKPFILGNVWDTQSEIINENITVAIEYRKEEPKLLIRDLLSCTTKLL